MEKKDKKERTCSVLGLAYLNFNLKMLGLCSVWKFKNAL